MFRIFLKDFLSFLSKTCLSTSRADFQQSAKLQAIHIGGNLPWLFRLLSKYQEILGCFQARLYYVSCLIKKRGVWKTCNQQKFYTRFFSRFCEDIFWVVRRFFIYWLLFSISRRIICPQVELFRKLVF